jgi:hypothetical protein
MLTRKDYNLLALEIKRQLEEANPAWNSNIKRGIIMSCRETAKMLSRNYSNFNHQKFLELALGEDI